MVSLIAFFRSFWQDLRYTLRQLRNAPVYALTAVLTLALGLGAATAMLAIVDSVLIRPVALPHAERLFSLARVIPTGQPDGFTFTDFDSLRAGVHSIEAFAGQASLIGPVTTPDGTRIADVVQVEPDFFRVPGVSARFGRVLTAQDAHAQAAVVNDSFWQNRLGGSHRAIGALIRVNSRAYTVIGIMPPGFSFPSTGGSEAVYLPLTLNAKGEEVHGFTNVGMTARLKPGVSPATALAEAQAIFAHAARPDPQNRGRMILRPYRDMITGDVQPALLALLGACALLLLIACVNAANLQIARAANRTGEISVRAALGATRGRLLRQLATESVVVSLLGAALGLVLADAVIHGVRTAYALQFPRFNELTLHPAVFAACAFLAVLTGILAALAPAWSVVRTGAGLAVTQAGRITRRSRVPSALIAVELALTCALLVTAGLFLRTFRALEQAPLGFDPHHVTEVTLIPLNPQEPGLALKQTYTRLLSRFATLPGVEAAATQTSLPFTNFNLSMTNTFKIAGRPANQTEQTDSSIVNSGYTRVLQVRPLQGRAFTASDAEGSQPVCMVNEPFVRRYLQGRRVLGAVFEFTSDATDGTDNRLVKTPLTIVGVLPDQVTGRNLANRSVPTVYLPFAQFPKTTPMTQFLLGLAPQFAVRSSLPQAALERELRAALKEAAPDMAEMQIASMEESIANSLTRQKLALRLAGGFGLLALLLAAVGIYGVLASSVAQRTREIGIRIALGAARGQTVLLVFRQAAWMVLFGLGAGLLCAWPAGRAVKAFLYGVTPLDPLSLGLAVFALLLVCAAAAAVPASRAARVDPVIALRSE